MKSKISKLLIFTLLAFLFMGAFTAKADTFEVDRNDDSADASAQVCSGAANDCSLRGAIIKANATSEVDEIIIPASNNDYVLNIPRDTETHNNAGTDPLKGDIDILNPIIITGAGADQTVIYADDLLDDRVFHSPGGSGAVTITGLTIENGKSGFRGGAIWNFDDDLTVEDCIFIGNYASSDGGAISYDTSGTLTIKNSTFIDNYADARGGALFFETGVGNITNSTFSGNWVTGAGTGGAISVVTGELNIEHVTIYDNEVQDPAGQGGGIYADGGVTFTVKNSLLIENIVNSTTDQNCSGVFTSLDFNISTDASCAFFEPGDQNSVATTLIETTLTDDGNGHLTYHLAAGSVAIDAITDDTACTLTEDQEGNPRPADADGDGDAFCDIGAYEVLGVDNSADDGSSSDDDSDSSPSESDDSDNEGSSSANSPSGCSLLSSNQNQSSGLWGYLIAMGMTLVLLQRRKVKNS